MRLFAYVIRTVGVWSLLATSIGHASLTPQYVTDLQGRTVTQFGRDGVKAVVFIFAATDCPISRRYIPEITRIEKQFASRGVTFWWVFPNPGDTASVVNKHELDFSIHSATLIDAQQELVRMAHVSVTPEVAVFATETSGMREIYQGRIDDRYISFGKARPQAHEHDLELAIEAALTGQLGPQPSGGPVGCSIVPLAQKP